eukprot:6580290-Pyramimonas_sp.AAC.1
MCPASDTFSSNVSPNGIQAQLAPCGVFIAVGALSVACGQAHRLLEAQARKRSNLLRSIRLRAQALLESFARHSGLRCSCACRMLVKRAAPERHRQFVVCACRVPTPRIGQQRVAKRVPRFLFKPCSWHRNAERDWQCPCEGTRCYVVQSTARRVKPDMDCAAAQFNGAPAQRAYPTRAFAAASAHLGAIVPPSWRVVAQTLTGSANRGLFPRPLPTVCCRSGRRRARRSQRANSAQAARAIHAAAATS